ncbi:MAG: hypothetical protein ACRDKZ_13995 [Actinomycetota bacterium]
MNFEEQLHDELDLMSRTSPAAPSWKEFAPRAHRRLRARRALAATAAGLIAALAVPAYLALGSEGERRGSQIVNPDQRRGTVAEACRPTTAEQPGGRGEVAALRGNTLYRVDVESGSQKVLAEGLPLRGGEPIRWSSSGAWIALDGRFVVAASAGEVCAPLSERAHGLTWSPTRDELAGIVEGVVRTTTPERDQDELSVRLDGPATGVAFDPEGERIAATTFRRRGASPKTESGLFVVDARTAESTEIVQGRSVDRLQLAGWSPDGEWILFWRMFAASESLNADGGPLFAVPASGGDPVKITDWMLPRRELLSDCGESLALTVGGGRSISSGKTVVRTGPPGWAIGDPFGLERKSTFWPGCTSDGRLAATATSNQDESPFGTLPRSVVIERPGQAPLEIDGFEYPVWVGEEDALLAVERERGPRADATLVLIDDLGPDAARRPVFDLGALQSSYGGVAYSERFDYRAPD